MLSCAINCQKPFMLFHNCTALDIHDNFPIKLSKTIWARINDLWNNFRADDIDLCINDICSYTRKLNNDIKYADDTNISRKTDFSLLLCLKEWSSIRSYSLSQLSHISMQKKQKHVFSATISISFKWWRKFLLVIVPFSWVRNFELG